MFETRRKRRSERRRRQGIVDFEVPGRADLVSKYYADFDEAGLGQRKYMPYG